MAVDAPPPPARNPPPPPPPSSTNPPPKDRRARRRAREISSRYLLSPSTSPETHFPSSPSFSDENAPTIPPKLLTCARRLDNHLSFNSTNSNSTALKRRSSSRVFLENSSSSGSGDESRWGIQRKTSRPGTPVVSLTDRVGLVNPGSDSIQRLASLSQNLQRSIILGKRTSSVSVGSKSEPSTPTRSDCLSEKSTFSDLVEDGEYCESPPLVRARNMEAASVSETRSSMPEADLLNSMLVRRDGDDNFCRVSVSSHRSSLHTHSNLTKSVNRPLIFSRTQLTGGKNVGPCLPPQAPGVKTVVDLKKARKVEEVHQLRLLHNQLVQWKFVNAKAQHVAEARAAAAQRALHEVSLKIEEQQEKVNLKRIELEHLERAKAASTILESQMPHLDDWDSMQDDYGASLSGAIKALQDVSLRVPVIGNVRADANEIGEVLYSARNMLDSLYPSVELFLPEAAGLEHLASDLARVVTGEKALIEECGELLSKVHNLQATECSLRSQLMQLRQVDPL